MRLVSSWIFRTNERIALASTMQLYFFSWFGHTHHDPHGLDPADGVFHVEADLETYSVRNPIS